ncbi:hypothetical protein PsYK624_151320 [Phanerochaete sordida]|uniref:Uncharacterized protein n=1 Tax=Phanerochaete sordida TaxID=48140 RepID=A0A9P3GST8_9APHY|nr:hypothetical protein PsYK624_151320 [Phanerochaete sordida]
MTKEENGAEGNAWKSFINQYKTGNPGPLPNGQNVTVVLKNVNRNGICASYVGGNKNCPAAVTPQTSAVAHLVNGHGSDDGIRQA